MIVTHLAHEEGHLDVIVLVAVVAVPASAGRDCGDGFGLAVIEGQSDASAGAGRGSFRWPRVGTAGEARLEVLRAQVEPPTTSAAGRALIFASSPVLLKRYYIYLLKAACLRQSFR